MAEDERDRPPRSRSDERSSPRPPRDGARTPRREGAKSRSSDRGKRPQSDSAKGRQSDSGKRPQSDGRPRRGDAASRREGSRPYRDGGRPRREGDERYRVDGKPRHQGRMPRQDGRSRPHRQEGSPSRDRGASAREGGRSSRPPERDGRRANAEPELPEEVTARDLHPAARNELKTLSKENADQVARHLVMVAALIDDDPARAHEHALAAVRRAGRVAVVRETAAITAYAIGDFALALRELRTYRRISGRDDQIALLVDSERGVGRPERALEVGRAVDRARLPVPVRVELAIALSGARLDLGEPERALLELDIPELDPNRAFPWSPALFAARATVLEELGRDDEAAEWRTRAEVAAEALDREAAADDVVIIDEIAEEPLDAPAAAAPAEPAPATADASLPESSGAEDA